MTARELALRAAVLEEVADRVAAAKTTARAELGDAMRADGIKTLTVLADGEDIGTATMAKGRRTVTARVSDPDALLAWARVHHPDQVETVTRVRPTFEARVLQQSKAAGVPCMDGVLDVPGVDVQISEGQPGLRMTPGETAPDVIGRMWARGVIDLRGLLELSGGEG